MFSLKRALAAAAAGVLSTLAVLPANAALIGVTKSFSDVSLSVNTLIYDANGVDANTGLLRVVSGASVLNSSAFAATIPQSYLADGIADVMLSFAINNATGALVANSTFNKVSIGFGTTASGFSFSWQGNIFAFGANANGTAFDARWSMTTDQYQNLAGSGLAGASGLFANGALAGMPGGLIISNTGAIGGTNIWAFDWVRGQFAGASGTAYAAQIAPYTTALLTTADRLSSTVVADIFVPLPAAAWLLFSGLITLVPTARRRLAAA